MIYKVEGDILLSKAQAIAHGVGINDPMDKGLALDVSQQISCHAQGFSPLVPST